MPFSKIFNHQAYTFLYRGKLPVNSCPATPRQLWSLEAPKHNRGSEKKKWGFWGDFFRGYIPKITENRPFFGRYHTKNRKLALWWPPNLGGRYQSSIGICRGPPWRSRMQWWATSKRGIPERSLNQYVPSVTRRNLSREQEVEAQPQHSNIHRLSEIPQHLVCSSPIAFIIANGVTVICLESTKIIGVWFCISSTK
jgi:hypothetical protein